MSLPPHRLLLVATASATLMLVGTGGASSSPTSDGPADGDRGRDPGLVFQVPGWVPATRESVTAFAMHVQNCTDLVRTWIGHGPRRA